MIALQSQHGELIARTFVLDGERALGVQVKMGSQVVGELEIKEATPSGAKSRLAGWLAQFGIQSGISALKRALTEEHATLVCVQGNGGLCPSQTYLGSRSSRRLGSPDYCAFA